MRVNREFHRPEVVRWLESKAEDEIFEALARQAFEQQCAAELTAEQQERIAEGFAQIDAGKSIPHEEMVDWVKSWGEGNERPEPTP